jgi:serine/threonine-protein kinase
MSYPDDSTGPASPPSPAAHLEIDGELAPGTVVGDFHVESAIGAGAMGKVYAALQPVIGKKAAIKVMASKLCVDPVAVDRFVQEARAVNQIQHPNIVDVFAFGSLPDGRSYMIMEWLQGETLGARMRRRIMPLGEVIAVLFQICDGLAAAHDKGIVHRDLKPENIFLVPVRGRRLLVKLLDFGVAKLRGVTGPRGPDHTAEGHSVGTPRYMSPEQARGKDTDHRADIYSLGVTAYEMVVGTPLFEGEEALDLMHKHVYEMPASPLSKRADLPPELDKLIVQMLEKRPDRRPTIPQIEALLVDMRDRVLAPRDVDTGPMGFRALEEGSGGHPMIRVPEPEPTDVVVTRKPRRRWAWITGGLLLGAAGAIGALSMNSRAPAPAVAAPVPAPVAAPEPPKPASLVVKVNAPDANIELDGKVLAQGVAEGRFDVEGGDHELTVSAAHRKTAHRTVHLNPGAEMDVDLALEKVALPAPPPPRPQPAPAKTHHKGDRDYMVDPFATKKK